MSDNGVGEDCGGQPRPLRCPAGGPGGPGGLDHLQVRVRSINDNYNYN